MKTIPALLCACLALTAAAPAQTTTPPVPQYYLAEIIQPPADPPATAHYVFVTKKLNAQNYALFLYDPDNTRPVGSDSYVLGVYTGQGRYIYLAQPANYTQVDTTNLSDTAADGSFYICGTGKTPGYSRGIVWHVSGDGTPSAPIVLQNYVRPPENTSPGEEADGGAYGINSQGFVVGGSLGWQLPSRTAFQFHPGDPESNYEVDEQGNYVGVTYGGSVRLNGANIPLTRMSGKAVDVRNGRMIGNQSDGPRSYAYVYPFNAPAVVELPDFPPQPNGGDETGTEFLSANGDIIGYSSAAAVQSGADPTGVLWKLQSDGSYQPNRMSEILAAIKPKGLGVTNPDYVRVNGFGADGSFLLGNFNGQSLKSLSALFRPGDPRPVITSASRVAAQVGKPFQFQLTATNNPTSFAYFSQVNSFPQSLPDGLTLDAQTGIISGTPTTAGTTGLYVHALNGLGDVNVNDAFLSIIVSTGPAAFFEGQVALGNGVYYLKFNNPYYGPGNAFGYYSYLNDPRFIYHFDLGYEYWFDALDGVGGIFFYDFASNGFFYTSPIFAFPYLYDFSLNTVVYYFPDPNNEGHYNTNGVRYFYRYDTGQIISK